MFTLYEIIGTIQYHDKRKVFMEGGGVISQ